MFRTPLSLSPIGNPISFRSRLLSCGSCFADFIGSELKSHKFDIVSNPVGIIFHPLAQMAVFKMALHQQLPTDDSYLCHQGIWYNYHFHSSVCNTSKNELQCEVKKRLTNLRMALIQADHLLLTFGTALQYRHKSTGLLVANCHKVPQPQFEKSLTSPPLIVTAFEEMMAAWPESPPAVILSVSPIRHLKEGIENNSVSKSVLRVVCEQICGLFPDVYYFPGYEIMMDDLRDYRFYEKDMIHPNDTARAYIWDLFKANYLDAKARKFADQWHKIAQNMNHQPFHPQSAAHQKFLMSTLAMIEALPGSVDTSEEVAILKRKLNES